MARRVAVRSQARPMSLFALGASFAMPHSDKRSAAMADLTWHTSADRIIRVKE
jgi:hypothetical protein